jgi:hypothetical protein
MRDAVIADVRRAAHLIDTGVRSFVPGEPKRLPKVKTSG